MASCFSKGTVWTPSRIIARLGKEINNEDSVYYWAYKVSDTGIRSLAMCLVGVVVDLYQ